MDSKSLEILEFPKVRELLAGFTAFGASKELALTLIPSSDMATVSKWLGQSAEARRLLSQEAGFSLGGASDIREAAEAARKGKMLEPQALLTAGETLAIARRARESLHQRADEFSLLWELGKDIVPLAYIEEHIAAAVAPSGEVLDSASSELSRLRRELREKRERLRSRLDNIVKSDRSQRFLQETVITERDGRYVVPIKAELKKEFRGIVHDVSNTGATVFIEPLATVELGNELREMEVAEKREVERILLALSAELGANVSEISVNIARMAAIDLALAKARFAARFKASESEIAKPQDGAVLKLVNARHPLLGTKAVPLSVEIGRDYSGLVITGPNTGGKTVALKTIGLLALMTLAGMPIPAGSGSVIPIFDGVFADIGDEQSIESTLSTFSWHMGNIIRIVNTSASKSLVLLDELGSSTDPEEGAALARAVLLYFLERGALIVATSHFNELKVFAHRTPGLQNASLDFDPVTLAPNYHLVVGMPGGSNALATAVRLGLPEQIVASAQSMMGKASQDLAELLNDLNSEKQRLEGLRRELEDANQKAQTLRRELETAQENFEKRQVLVLNEERDRVVAETAELQRLIRQTAADLKKTRSEAGLEQAREALSSVRGRLRKTQPPVLPSGKTAEIKAGDRVLLGDIGLEATVLSVDKKNRQVEVQAGVTRARVGLGSITRVDGTPVSKPSVRSGSGVQLSPKAVPLELDLRGKRADEVAPLVDAYLNDATLANLDEVRIIHGFGTGVVRQIVRDLLASHPLAKGFRSGGRGEGGDGATVVSLKEA